jgi:energy-coupling factor transporter ATP-binding protein EcfA2
MEIVLDNIRQSEGIIEDIMPLKANLEKKLNLSRQVGDERGGLFTWNKVMRICLIASLSLSEKRSIDDLESYILSRTSQRIQPSFFTKDNKRSLFSALLKFRYKDCNVNWNDASIVGKIIAKEIHRGLQYLSDEDNLNSFLFSVSDRRHSSNDIPALELLIGEYDDDMEAKLNINGRSISNAQILIAGTTGSGKTNLLAVLIQQFRNLSTDTPYPVNFLLFDYKGEFSDPANNNWLTYFDIDRSSILDPVQQPLPFTPFKDFTGKTINEINLYSTEMANALCSIERASISANMSNRLSEAIVDAYKETKGVPITFELMLSHYQAKMPNPDKDDSITSVLKQLERNNIFATEDKVNLINECFIIKMDSFPKDGPIAKAIVYFVISKLNIIYESLEKQASNDDFVQIRHFTIIDEAHYMLDFDNHPLRNLIAVGRNKGLSIILATQNMDSFKSKHFDFYANAQYPLIMKQQSIPDSVIKDLFGVAGKEYLEIKTAIASLQKGELIIKDNTMSLLGISGKNYKKIKVTHLI